MENKPALISITVKGIIDIIFRNRLLIIITFIICIIGSLIGIQFITPLYDAEVKMLVRGQTVTASDTYAPLFSRSVHSTQAEIVKSLPVLKRAVMALDLQNRPLDYEKQFSSDLKKIIIDFKIRKAEKKLSELSEEDRQEALMTGAVGSLKDRLTVKMVPGTDIFIINVEAFTPEEAVETANVISRSYTMFDQIQQLAEVRMRYGEFHPTVIQLIDNINEATKNLSGKTLPDVQAIGTASVKIIEQATSSGLPTGKPKRIIFAIAFLASICISFGLAIVKGLFDWTIKTPQDIADHVDIPCIGSIPKKQWSDKYLITDNSKATRYYQFYEELAEQILVFLKTQGLKSAVVISPTRSKSHRFIVPNIGYFLTRIMGNRVLLADINFNKPQFQGIYSINADEGINGDEFLPVAMDLIHKTERGPELLPARFSDKKTSIILRDTGFKNFIDQNKNEYDAILIDATSFDNMKEASSFTQICDGIIIIIDEGKLQRKMFKNSLPRLKGDDIVIIGGILNNRTFPIPDFIYKYFKYLLD